MISLKSKVDKKLIIKRKLHIDIQLVKKLKLD